MRRLPRLRRYIAQREGNSRLQTDTIPQTAYDYYDYNDYNDYDDLRAQVLWTIEPAIDKSSANDPLTLSKQKLLAAQALMATLDDNAKSISIRQT
jgi:hypothetical protein